MKSNIVAWELEIRPCEHVLTLNQVDPYRIASGCKIKKFKQFFNIIKKALAHCLKCDLSSNLWLCLACGKLACGRKNYDGTGGNGHALEHSKESKHPMAVKLGTITPEGQACILLFIIFTKIYYFILLKKAVYCYDCDDEVEDINLGAHLNNFGIEVSKMQKTEKTMTELVKIKNNSFFSFLILLNQF